MKKSIKYSSTEQRKITFLSIIFLGMPVSLWKDSILSHLLVGFIPPRRSHQYRFQRCCRGCYGLLANITSIQILCLTTLINWSPFLKSGQHLMGSPIVWAATRWKKPCKEVLRSENPVAGSEIRNAGTAAFLIDPDMLVSALSAEFPNFLGR